MSLQQDIDNLGTGTPYPYDRLLVRGVGTIDVVGTFTAIDLPVTAWFQLAITPTGIALAVDGVGKGMISSCEIKTGFPTYTSHRPANLSSLISDQDINTITLQKSALPITPTANDSHEKIVAGFVKALLTHFSQAVWDANVTTMLRAIESESFIGGAATISLAFELNDLAWVHNDVTAPQVYIPGTGAYGSALPDGTEHERFLLVSSALPASILVLVFTWVESAGVWELTHTDTDFALLQNSFDPTGKTILFEGYYSASPSIAVEEIFETRITTLLHESFYSSPPTIEVVNLFTYPPLPYTRIWPTQNTYGGWDEEYTEYLMGDGIYTYDIVRTTPITKYVSYVSGNSYLYHLNGETVSLFLNNVLQPPQIFDYTDNIPRIFRFEYSVTPVKRVDISVMFV